MKSAEGAAADVRDGATGRRGGTVVRLRKLIQPRLVAAPLLALAPVVGQLIEIGGKEPESA